jgi:hypothetical protein
MGNKLKEMLDKKNIGLAFTLNFKNQTDRTDFINAINKIQETGQPQKVPIPESMEMKKTVCDYQYPYDNIENIVGMAVYPSQNLVQIPIWVDKIPDNYTFFRTKNNDTLTLNSVNPKIIDVKLDLNIIDNNLNFTYTSHPGNAETIDELIHEYKRLLALIDSLFQKQKTLEKLEDIKNYYKNSLNAMIRAKELSEVLKIDINPQTLIDENDNEHLIEKMYLLLVKNSIIRQNNKLNHIEMANVENIDIGQELFATYCQHGDLEIFGVHRDIYTVNCIFGAIIQRFETKENGNSIVYFKDSEKNPMYRAYSAFTDEKAAEMELKRIPEKREQYENADNWLAQLKDLLHAE